MINGEWNPSERSPLYSNEMTFILHAGQHPQQLKTAPRHRTIYFHISCSPQDSSSAMHPSRVPMPPLILQQLPRVKLLFRAYFRPPLPVPNKDRKINALFDLLLLELHFMRPKFHTQDTLLTLAKTVADRPEPQNFTKQPTYRPEYRLVTETLNQRFREAAQNLLPIPNGRKITGPAIRWTPRLKLQTVALNFGFYDEFHLNKIFKKLTLNLYPSVYRKTLTAKHPPPPLTYTLPSRTPGCAHPSGASLLPCLSPSALLPETAVVCFSLHLKTVMF